MEENILSKPAVALKGIVVLPEMVVSFDISGEKAVESINKSLNDDNEIFLVTKKERLF